VNISSAQQFFTRPYCMPLVVTTTDLMFRKNVELLWFDKLHVEMDFVWF